MDLPRATAEIVSLHEFLVDWLRGTCAKDEALLTERFSTHFASDLTFADPTGKVLGTSELVDGFRAEYGTAPEIEIEVRNVRAHLLAGESGVFSYEEWHGPTGRITTVVLRDGGAAGVEWTHLQETMIA